MVGTRGSSSARRLGTQLIRRICEALALPEGVPNALPPWNLLHRGLVLLHHRDGADVVDALRPCKDCLPGSKRPAPHPGPRCTTHHRAFKKAQKARNHDAAVVRTYGLAPGEYDRIYAAQGGVCAICLRSTGATKRLAVDHNHATGAVRGLLCGPDNQYIGHLHNSPEAFIRAAIYLCEGDPERIAAVKAYLNQN